MVLCPGFLLKYHSTRSFFSGSHKNVKFRSARAQCRDGGMEKKMGSYP